MIVLTPTAIESESCGVNSVSTGDGCAREKTALETSSNHDPTIRCRGDLTAIAGHPLASPKVCKIQVILTDRSVMANSVLSALPLPSPLRSCPGNAE